MSTTEPLYPDFLIVGKLSIERCQNHLAHLHALMHLCRPEGLEFDSLVAESVLSVMESIERELAQSAKALSMFE